eukprot:Unigene3418_Nuclearia_a/m.10479 Unigene3418_Nuclearia_a/g.10479  ORF Unigene3418_Nuclearia_a/g.10479 Unigene3418_Nuclearia_a/m.10479 type:complete len:184 (+) Unigene3418_Nuclearia_a:30-581(+)
MGAVDCLTVVFFSLVSAALAEGLSWFLVYRTDAFKHMTREVERQTKKLEKIKETAAPVAAGAKKDRKADRYEEQLKKYNRDIQQLSMRSTLAVSVVLLGMLWALTSVYQGHAVAKLPFEPIGWFTAMTHRSLPGTDMTDASAFFLYSLCSLSLRQMLQRALGFSKKLKGTDFMTALAEAQKQQ